MTRKTRRTINKVKAKKKKVKPAQHHESSEITNLNY